MSAKFPTDLVRLLLFPHYSSNPTERHLPEYHLAQDSNIMPSRYEDWFHYRPSQEPVEWTSDCDETTHMRAFLSGLVSAEDTAFKLVQTSTDPSDDIGNKQWRLWNLLFDIAAELPETQCHLVTLLKAFQTLDNPGDWETDWTKLGSFGSMWRDAWNCKYSLPY